LQTFVGLSYHGNRTQNGIAAATVLRQAQQPVTALQTETKNRKNKQKK
jgi:hypothetical protein